jgi:hypothetical protein
MKNDLNDYMHALTQNPKAPSSEETAGEAASPSGPSGTMPYAQDSAVSRSQSFLPWRARGSMPRRTTRL